MIKYLLRYSDSETKFFDHIVVKSNNQFFKYYDKYLLEELTGTILLEYMVEHFEVLHPHFKIYLSRLCKFPAKYYKNILSMRLFLKKLHEIN